MNFPPPFHFAVPVWGESYVLTYLNYCLPAQLATGNIPSLKGSARHRYTIYTTRADHACIAVSPAFHMLQKIISVEVEYIDAALCGADVNKYHVKSDCYRRAFEHAKQYGAAVVALNADVLLSNGFIQLVEKLIFQGKRVIEVAGPRGLCNPIMDVLNADYRSADGISISIEPIELSSLWLKNMHPQLQMHFVEGVEGAPFHPSHLYWSVGSEGVIIRGFHLYPIVIYPGRRNIEFSTTIDDDLVGNLGLSVDERFLVQDSRVSFCCELSPEDYHVSHVAPRGDLDICAKFFCSYAEQNLLNLQKEIVITGVRELGVEWDVRKRRSATFVKCLVKRCRVERRRKKIYQFIKSRMAGVKSLSVLLPLRIVVRKLRYVGVRLLSFLTKRSK